MPRQAVVRAAASSGSSLRARLGVPGACVGAVGARHVRRWRPYRRSGCRQLSACSSWVSPRRSLTCRTRSPRVLRRAPPPASACCPLGREQRSTRPARHSRVKFRPKLRVLGGGRQWAARRLGKPSTFQPKLRYPEHRCGRRRRIEHQPGVEALMGYKLAAAFSSAGSPTSQLWLESPLICGPETSRR